MIVFGLSVDRSFKVLWRWRHVDYCLNTQALAQPPCMSLAWPNQRKRPPLCPTQQVEDVIKQTPPSRRSKFDRNRLKENGRSILGDHFSCNPHMIELVLSLRSIYNKHPDDCRIQIALIVSTVKFIVAYGTGKKRGDDIKRVVMRGVT